MTQFNPTLILTRLVVTRRGAAVYDEQFHSGVNIIRGTNSSGKSTIADLIFFVLGGEGCRFKEQALRCDSVFAEILINGQVVSLRRDIEAKKFQPLYISWAPLNAEQSESAIAWEKYSFARSETKESFSQVLFRVMEMPEVKGQGSANLTMHQLLRMMYVDQETPGAKIFRYEQFDSALTRETIGNLMCGVYNDELYADELSLAQAEKEFESIAKQLRDIFDLLGQAQQDASVEHIRAKIASYRSERIDLYQELKGLKNSQTTARTTATAHAEKQKGLREKLHSLREKIADMEKAAEVLRLDIADSEYFIKALNQRLAAIREGMSASEQLGNFFFSFCPSCFAPVNEQEDKEICPLCKSRAQEASYSLGLAKMRNQLEIQSKESLRLLERKTEKLNTIEQGLPSLYAEEEAISLQYEEAVANVSTGYDNAIQELSIRIGYTDSMIETLIEKERLFGLLEGLIERKSHLSAKISELKDKVKGAQAVRSRLRKNAYLSISEKVVELLKRDLERQEVFKEAESVDLDFGADLVTVNKEQYFSASSMVYLRNSFHLAVLAASANNDFFRYPRFLLIDDIEEGGMEVERSHNLQKLIVELSESLQAQHQIIFTTSEIDNGLEKSPLTIGEHFTTERKSLRFN